MAKLNYLVTIKPNNDQPTADQPIQARNMLAAASKADKLVKKGGRVVQIKEV